MKRKVMRIVFGFVIMVLAGFIALPTANAKNEKTKQTKSSKTKSSRCPAGDSGCTAENAGERIQERANEGARKVITNENSVGRVKEAARTVKDCINCGMDAVKDGADRVTGKKR